MAWTAAEIPWLIACWRRIRRAQAGGPLEPPPGPPPPALDENALPEMTEETPRAAVASAPALARRVAAPATPSPPAAKAGPTAAPAPSCGAPAVNPVSNPRTEDAEAEQRERGQYKREHIVEGR